MKQKPIEELIKPYTIKYVAETIMVNYSTLQSQLNPNHPNKLSIVNEYKIRQAFTK